MIVTICSIFRDSQKYLNRYFDQVINMWDPDKTRHVLVEGDSVDHTWSYLKTWTDGRSGRAKLIKHDTGTPYYGSIESEDRWSMLAKVVNDAYDNIYVDTDVVVWVESDLIIPGGTLDRLLEHMEPDRVIVPYIQHYGRNTFYDTWAFRLNGQRFVADSPYHQDAQKELFRVDSAGSMFVIPAKFIKMGARFPEDPKLEATVGFSAALYNLGASIWADPNTIIYHPI